MLYRWIFWVFLFVGGLPLGAVGGESSAPRAKPPKWPAEVREVFFDDVREHLVGVRPGKMESAGQVVARAEVAQRGAGRAWSDVIDADTLTTEIKRVVNQVARTVQQAGAFKSDGYRLCERDFGLLTIWFGLVEEFDEEVRWQRDAGAMRSYLVAAAESCAEGNDESLAAAQQASELLADLMRGQSPELPQASGGTSLDGVAALGDLMHRMKLASEEKIVPSLVRVREFRKGRAEIAREAQVLSVLARIIKMEGYDYAEDETYLEYANQLQQAAAELVRAAQESDFQAAEEAGGRVTGACAACHEDYRG